MDQDVEIKAADDLTVEDFILRGNAIDAGQEPPAVAVVEATATTDETKPDAESEVKVDDDKPRDETTGQFKAPDKKASPQKRIDSAVAKQREAEREAADLRARIAALEARPVAEAAKPAAAAPVTASDKKRYLEMDDAPKLADYDGSDGKTYEDYSADVAVFIADKRFDERMAVHTANESQRQRMTAWDAKMQKAEAKIPDLRTRIQTAAGERTLPQPIIDYIVKRDSGPELLLHLAEHPADHQRVTTLPLDDAIELLVTIRQTLEGSAKPTASHGPVAAPVISAAKPPIKPLGNSPHVIDDDAGDEDSWPVEKHISVYNAKDPNITPRAARH